MPGLAAEDKFFYFVKCVNVTKIDICRELGTVLQCGLGVYSGSGLGADVRPRASL